MSFLESSDFPPQVIFLAPEFNLKDSIDKEIRQSMKWEAKKYGAPDSDTIAS